MKSWLHSRVVIVCKEPPVGQPLMSRLSHLQPWPSVSNQAKDFIQSLLQPDPAARLTAQQAIRHPWVLTLAAGSSTRNLHRCISQNLRLRASRSSSRCLSRATSAAEAGDCGGGGRLHTPLERKANVGAVRQSIWTEQASEDSANARQGQPGASSQSN